MNLTCAVKLNPSALQRDALLATMARCNQACNWLAEQAFYWRITNKFDLQRRFYGQLRSDFSLSSQMAIHVVRKVCEAYKRNRRRLCQFRPTGAIVYDQRTYSLGRANDLLSLLTLDGRISVPVVCGAAQRELLRLRRGQADLILRKGKLYLYISVTEQEPSTTESTEFLGVDLGIVQLATDSDGTPYSGDGVERVRKRYFRLRQVLQPVKTRSSRKHLRKIAGKEARFRAIENHRISKQLVLKAKGTGRGIALEDLTGIHDRTTVRRGQRARHVGWAFFQLRQFITYKARRFGVYLVLVNPRYTSQACPSCGCVDRRNRKSQAEFRCVACGFRGNADVVGATNVARAAVNRPIVPDVRTGNCGQQHRSQEPRLCQGQGLAL